MQLKGLLPENIGTFRGGDQPPDTKDRMARFRSPTEESLHNHRTYSRTHYAGKPPHRKVPPCVNGPAAELSASAQPPGR